MKAYLLLGLVLATPALAQAPAPAGRSPQDAAKAALAACVDHAASVTVIEGASGKELDAAGLKYQRDAPDFLASTRSSVLGLAQYAKSPSTQGEIWAIGYDSNACMVVTLAAPVADAEKGYLDYFANAKGWRPDRTSGSPRPGERLLTYGWTARRNLRLTAVVSLRDADNTSTVTITRAPTSGGY